MGSPGPHRASLWIRWAGGPLLALVLVLQLLRVLFAMGFYRPGKMYRSLVAWRLFFRAEKVALGWMDIHFPMTGGSPIQRRRLLRYARNALGLTAIQPWMQQQGWIWPRRQCAIGTAYGLCIPLYDDCFDEVSPASARAFAEAFHESLSGELWRPDQVPDGMSDAPEALRSISCALWSEIEAPHRVRFTELLREMNLAQLDSLEEHMEGTPPERLREISARKGVASFRLLLSAVGDLEAHRKPALTAAAIWAQWMDDYDDLESDRAQGTITFIAQLEDEDRALEFIRDELRSVLRALEDQFGASSRLFADVLALNFVIKTAHQRTVKVAQRWRLESAMPRFFWKGAQPEDPDIRSGREPRLPTS
jgi:hypothetical protein